MLLAGRSDGTPRRGEEQQREEDEGEDLPRHLVGYTERRGPVTAAGGSRPYGCSAAWAFGRRADGKGQGMGEVRPEHEVAVVGAGQPGLAIGLLPGPPRASLRHPRGGDSIAPRGASAGSP